MLDMESGTIHPKLEPEGEAPDDIPYCWTHSVNSILTEDSNSSQRFLSATSPDLNIHMESQEYQPLQQRYMAQSEGQYSQHYETPHQQYNEYAPQDCYYDNSYYNADYQNFTDINENTSATSGNKAYEQNSCSMLTLTQKQEFTFNYNNDANASSCTFQINQCMFP